MSALGRNLAKLMWEHGINTTDLANAAGVTRRTIANILDGGDTRLSTITMLAGALNVPVTTLIGEPTRLISITEYERTQHWRNLTGPFPCTAKGAGVACTAQGGTPNQHLTP